MTAADRCVGHVRGTAGENEHARAWRRWHHLGGRVRPVLGNACLVGKGRWPAAAVRWDFEPSGGLLRRSRSERWMPCDLQSLFADHAHSGPPKTSVPGAARGPGVDQRSLSRE
jgi:hypothetical protein